MRNHLIDELERIAGKDDKIVILTADLGFSVLEHFAVDHPTRCYKLGICEQNMTSVAAGLALSGKEVYTYSIGNFPVMRCLEQIRNDICYHDCNVKVIAVGGGFAYGKLGMSHHATEDFAEMRMMPNMIIFSPSGPTMAEHVIRAAHATKGPCYIRLERRGEKDLYAVAPNADAHKITEVVAGDDVAVISSGTVLAESLKAAEQLKAKGLSIGVYDCTCLKPIDRQCVRGVCNRYKAILTIEEHSTVGGLGDAVAEVINEEGLIIRIVKLGLQNTFTCVVGDQQYLRHYYHIDAETIETKVDMLLRAVK